MICHFVSYPKSGRTWLRYALTTLSVANQIRFHHDGFEFNDGSRPPHDFDFNRRFDTYSDIERVVFLSRDPRDIIVSLYFQVNERFRDFFQYQGTISEFIHDDYFGAENLRKFQNIWDRLCAEGCAMRVTYEECHEDFVSVLHTITTYYGFEFTRQKLQLAADAASFERMKALEQSESFPHTWLRPKNGALKVRRGVVGSYTDYLSSDDINHLNRLFHLE